MSNKNRQQDPLTLLLMWDKLKEFLTDPNNHLLIRHSNQEKYHYVHHIGILSERSIETLHMSTYTSLGLSVRMAATAGPDYHATKLELVDMNEPAQPSDTIYPDYTYTKCDKTPGVVLKLTFGWNNKYGRSIYLYLLNNPSDRDWKKYFSDGK